MARRIAIVCTALAGLLILAVWLIVSTRAGARIVIAQLGRLSTPIQVETVEGSLRSPLVLRRIELKTENLSVNIDSVAVDWRLSGLLRRRLNIADIQINGIRVEISEPTDSARLEKEESPLRRQVSLPIDIILQQGTARDLTVRTHQGVDLRNGHFTASGRLAEYVIEGVANVHSPRFDTAAARLTAVGSLNHLEIAPLNIDVLSGTVQLSGLLRWGESPEWDLSLKADSLAPAALFAEPAEWPGWLSGRARSMGSLSDGGLVATFGLDTLLGVLRGQPVSGRLAGSLGGPRYSLESLRLGWGSAQLSADGTLGDEFDFAFAIDVPDLGALYPNASGAFSSAGNLSGSRPTPTVRAELKGSAISVARLQLASLDGQLNFDPGDPESAILDLTATRIRIGDQSIGEATIRGQGFRSAESPGAIAIQRADADLLDGRVSITGSISWQPTIAWRLELEADSLAPATLFAEPRGWPGRISARATSEGQITEGGPVARFDIDTLYGRLRGAPLGGQAAASVSGQAYSLHQFALDWGSAKMRAAGIIADTLGLSLDAEIPNLAIAYPGASGELALRGRLAGTRALPIIQGSLAASELSLADYRVGELTGQIDLGKAERNSELRWLARDIQIRGHSIDRIALTGRGIRSARGLGGISIDSAAADLLGGQIRGRGRFEWRPVFAWQLSLDGEDIAPGTLSANPDDWPGTLSLAGSSEGRLTDSGLQATFAIDTISGSLRQQRLSAKGIASIDRTVYVLSRLELLWGRSHLRAEGTVSDTLDLTFELDAPDLAMALPGATGASRVTGSASGSRSAPILTAAATARALAYDGYRLGELDGRFDIDLGDPGKLDVDITATELAVATQVIERFNLRARGTMALHELTASLLSADPNVEFSLRGGLTADGWEGSLQRAEVESPLAGRWRLDASSPLTVTRNGFRLDDFCLMSGDASLCGSGSREQNSGWQIASSLEKAPLSVASAFLPEGWSITGTVDGKLNTSTGADGDFQADIELHPGPGTLTFPLAGDSQTVAYDRGRLVASTESGDLQVGVNLALTDTSGAQYGMLAGELRLPGFSRLERPRPEQTLAGRIQGQLSDLSFIEALDTRLSRTRGRLELDIRAAGTVGAATLIGQLQLRDAEADVPPLGIALRDIQFNVTGDGRGNLVFDGRLSSAPGQLTIRGESPIVPTAGSPARFTIVGQRFQAANTSEVQLLASPNIEVSLSGERIEFGGEIAIPVANIELSQIPETAIQLSKDAVFVGPAEERRLRQTLISGRVRIVLGDQVSFRGFGFTTKLAGSLLAIEEPGKATAGSGELRIVDGRYKAYGQNLTINPGRVVFGGGPIDNPGLDVRAYRIAADSILAGLLIKGTLRSPEVTLFSEPPMAESEALSYLVLGRPLGEASRAEGDVVSKAATSLGLRGGNLLAQRIASTVGLDEARIQTGRSLQDASLVAGKYLSPRLYAAYGIGLFDHASTFRVRYLLSSRWTLVGETGQATSADLMYRLERGG